jgi:hypothetical protein
MFDKNLLLNHINNTTNNDKLQAGTNPSLESEMNEKVGKKITKSHGKRYPKGTHMCATHVEHAEWGTGTPIHGQHAEPDENGHISWYTAMFEHGEELVETEDVKVLGLTEHENHDHNGDELNEVSYEKLVNAHLAAKRELSTNDELSPERRKKLKRQSEKFGDAAKTMFIKFGERGGARDRDNTYARDALQGRYAEVEEGKKVSAPAGFHFMKHGEGEYKLMKNPKGGFKPHEGGSEEAEFPIQKVHEEKNCGCGQDPCKTYGKKKVEENTLNDPVETPVADAVQMRRDGAGPVMYDTRRGGRKGVDLPRLKKKAKKTEIGLLVRLGEEDDHQSKLSKIIAGIRGKDLGEKIPGRGEEPTDHHNAKGTPREKRGLVDQLMRNVEASHLKRLTKHARAVVPDIRGSEVRDAILKKSAERLGDDL